MIKFQVHDVTESYDIVILTETGVAKNYINITALTT
jgi:hypothetical protein